MSEANPPVQPSETPPLPDEVETDVPPVPPEPAPDEQPQVPADQ